MAKYTAEERKRAVELLIKYDLSIHAVICELGYPSRGMLYLWYREYQASGNVDKYQQSKSKYSPEQRKQAVDYYVAHGRSIARTIKALGYPGKTRLAEWINGDLPQNLRRWNCKSDNSVVKYTHEQKEEIVKAYCINQYTPKQITEIYGVCPGTLYTWKKQLLGQEKSRAMPKNKKVNFTHEPNLTDETIDNLRTEKEALEQQVLELQKDIHKLQLERDILEKAGEILKKDRGINLKTLTNREKAVLIDALREKYRLNELLTQLHMAKSSYCYQENALRAPDRYSSLRTQISAIFEENYCAYGYRWIYSELRKEGVVVSEKVIRRIMAQENLAVYKSKTKKYNSYRGEITPAVENLLNRDFHAAIPNTKWLADITEFGLPAGKVYLSPIIDCFDGLVVSWSIGTSPDAQLVNSMLDDAMSMLNETEHPMVHTDRGCHYRWPGWISRMEEAGLVRSMSQKGCSPDNSACEGFFGRLKNEMYYGRSWFGVTVDQFVESLNAYIHWYNEKRIKSSLGGMSPIEYRKSIGWNNCATMPPLLTECRKNDSE